MHGIAIRTALIGVPIRAVALVGLVLASEPGADVPVALRWEVEGCDAAEAAQRAAELGLRHDPTSARRAAIALRRDGSGVTARVRVEVDDVVVERELAAEGCAVAADAALLVVGAQLRVLEIEAAEDPPAASTAPPTVTRPATTMKPDPVEAPKPAAKPRPLGSFWLGAAGAVSFGPLPRATSRWALALAWQGELARVQVEGAHYVRRTVSITPDVDARVMAFGAALRGGVAPRWQTLRFPVLLGVEIDDLVGQARGRVVDPAIGHAPWVGATLDAGVFWAAHPRVGLELMGGPSVTLASRRFGLRDDAGNIIPVPTAPRFGGRVGLSIFFRVK
jgi:hypothetical protein